MSLCQPLFASAFEAAKTYRLEKPYQSARPTTSTFTALIVIPADLAMNT
jgi:hypothetical protein